MKNIKKTLLFASVVIACACSSTPKDSWTLELNITDAKEGDRVKISYLDGNKKDTTLTLKDGKASLTCHYTDPTWLTATLTRNGVTENNEENYSISSFINAAGEKISISSVFDSISRTNPKGGMYELESFDTLRKLNKITFALQDDYLAAFKNKDNAKIAQIMKDVEANWQRTTSTIMYFIEKNPDLFYSAYLLSFISAQIPLDTLNKAYGLLSDKIKEHEIGRNIKNSIDVIEKSVEIGKEAPDFNMISTEGKSFSLASYRGKWLILDFWGSWCSPCRMSNPALVSTYKKYKDKGLEIVGIALNDTEERVKKAMIEDGITWANVSLDTQKEDVKSMPMLYKITAVPTKILINPQGVVEIIEIPTENRDSQISLKLKELFD